MTINEGSRNCCTFCSTNCYTAPLKNTSKTMPYKGFTVAKKHFFSATTSFSALILL